MDGDHFNEFITRKSLIVAVILALGVWAMLTYLLTPFIPTEKAGWAYLWAAFTATPLVGVSFLAFNMFWIVAMEHRKAKNSA